MPHWLTQRLTGQLPVPPVDQISTGWSHASVTDPHLNCLTPFLVGWHQLHCLSPCLTDWSHLNWLTPWIWLTSCLNDPMLHWWTQCLIGQLPVPLVDPISTGWFPCLIHWPDLNCLPQFSLVDIISFSWLQASLIAFNSHFHWLTPWITGWPHASLTPCLNG